MSSCQLLFLTEFQLAFLPLHLFRLWLSVLHYTNLSNLSCFTPINGKDGSVQLFPCVVVVTLGLTLHTHTSRLGQLSPTHGHILSELYLGDP